MDLQLRYFSLMAALVFGLCVPSLSTKASGVSGRQAAGQQERTLRFYNTHTRESLSVTYWRKGRYDRNALEEISDYLRDHRNGHVHEISHNLMNVLYSTQQGLQRLHPEQEIVFHVISGYRSPQSNGMLRANGGGQAKKSRHMQGDAIDIRVPGISTVELRNMAWCQQRGGVGYYRGSDFVHVDTHTKKTTDGRFPGGKRYRAWGWSPKPGLCAGRPNS